LKGLLSLLARINRQKMARVAQDCLQEALAVESVPDMQLQQDGDKKNMNWD